MSDTNKENPPAPEQKPQEAAPPEKPDTVIEKGVQALKDLRTSIEQKVNDVAPQTEAVKKWYEESRDALATKTAASLEAIKKEVTEIRKLDKKELAKDVLENINTTLNSIISSTRSEVSNLLSVVKEEGMNFMRTWQEKGFMEAVRSEGADLLAGGMRLLESMRNSAAFTFGPILKMMGLDEMVGGDRILLANALKRAKIKGMRIDDNAPEATFEYVSEQYDAHFAGGQLTITKPVFFQRLVTRLRTDILKDPNAQFVTYKQLNDTVDLLVKDQQEALKKQPAPAPATPPAPTGPTPAPVPLV